MSRALPGRRKLGRAQRRAERRDTRRGIIEAAREWHQRRASEAEQRKVQRELDREKKRLEAGKAATAESIRWIVKHEGPNRAQRRAYARRTGRKMPKATNVPHVNPARQAKKLHAAARAGR